MVHGFGRAAARISLLAVAAAMMPAQAQDAFLGELMYNPYNFEPTGYAYCNGQLVAISTNTALFSLLGTFYGGNGTSNFQLPDMRGRVPIHQGQGLGLSSYVIGQTGGTETVTLLQGNIPQHAHSLSGITAGAVSASSANANSAVPASHVLANTGHNPAYSAAAPDVSLASMTLTGTSATVGGGLPFSVRSPYLAVSCVIATQGIFPPRN
jgi:microcystin-dependent protein